MAASSATVNPSVIGSRPSRGEFGQLDDRLIGIEHHHLAERTRIDEPQLLGRSTSEVQDDMGVIGPRRTAVAHQDPPTHPEVDHQRIAGVERADDVLAAAPDRGDGCAGEAVDQRLTRRAPNRSFATDLDPVDTTPDDERHHAPTNGLDLGELGHGYSRVASAS